MGKERESPQQVLVCKRCSRVVPAAHLTQRLSVRRYGGFTDKARCAIQQGLDLAVVNTDDAQAARTASESQLRPQTARGRAPAWAGLLLNRENRDALPALVVAPDITTQRSKCYVRCMDADMSSQPKLRAHLGKLRFLSSCVM